MTDQHANIILTGFMGTGKTAVGQALATVLQRTFVDLDDVIEARAGCSISELFARQGEAAFRRREQEACREVARRRSLVIATGGGTIIQPGNEEILRQTGCLICLTASPARILERVGSDTHRPLLESATASRAERIATLLAARAPIYDAVRWQIDTTDLAIPDVVAAIQQRLDLAMPIHEGHTIVTVNANVQKLQIRSPENVYPIWVGEGMLEQVGEAMQECGLRQTDVGIVTNPQIAALYRAPLEASLARAGFTPHLFTMPEGERYKVLDTVRDLYSQCVQAQLDRSSTIVALGGGVVTDVAGFLAATYLRGVPYFPVPSTVLSMVDSSVGAKSGVDLPEGKNLVGAFKQPAGVVIDPGLMDSLPPAEIIAGSAEVLKHAIVSDTGLLEMLETEGLRQRTAVLTRAIQVKIDIVEEDPYEQGRRSVLNLGHTFAHALEHVSGYRIRHGEAVGAGLVAAAYMSVQLGRCAQATADRIERIVHRMGLPTRVHQITSAQDRDRYDPEILYAAMATDKKRQGARLRFVVLDDIESVHIIDHPGDAFVLDAWYYILTDKQGTA